MTIAVLCGVLALLAAAIRDLLYRTIPDLCVVLAGVSGLILRFDSGSEFLVASLGIALLLFVTMTFLFHLDAVGGGDVKLMAAASLLVPPSFVLGQLVLIAFAGGVLAMFWLLLCKLRVYGKLRGGEVSPPESFGFGVPPRRNLCSSSGAPSEAEFENGGLPYGVAICAGTLVQLALVP